ncbi:reverse transcriptase domain-containing protein [Tanacetum coccineum]
MPFKLKNAEATYQRLVDTIFEGQIGQNLKAYVDEMVIKSKTKQDLIRDVEEILLTLKKVLANFLANTITEVGQTQKEVLVKEDIPESSKAKDTIGERDLALRLDTHIPRAQNKKADALSKLAAVQLDHLTKEVLVEVLNDRSIDIAKVNMVKIPLRSAVEVRRFVAGKLCDQGDTYGLLRNARWTKKSGLQSNKCRFGIPTTIITNSGTQIVNEPFKSRAERKVISTSVYHPQANRAVQRANRSLMKGIKTGLCKEEACWVEELPNVLWAHRTIQRQTMEKPHSV